jgi:hypothetical protein
LLGPTSHVSSYRAWQFALPAHAAHGRVIATRHRSLPPTWCPVWQLPSLILVDPWPRVRRALHQQSNARVTALAAMVTPVFEDPPSPMRTVRGSDGHDVGRRRLSSGSRDRLVAVAHLGVVLEQLAVELVGPYHGAGPSASGRIDPAGGSAAARKLVTRARGHRPS